MYREKFQHILKTNNFSVDEIRNKFEERTFSRSELIGFLNMNTIEDVNNFPCNTVSGLKPGAPCSFPFVFPDCGLSVKAKRCGSGSLPMQQPVSHTRCNENDICFTRTYQNDSALLGQFADCNARCSGSVR